MDRIKILVAAFVLLVAIWLAYNYLSFSEEAKLKLGTEVNLETFSSILSDAERVYIVMDVRDVDDHKIKTNILQCGVDFAGSQGLVGKNLTIYSFDSEQGCVGIDQNYPLSYCIKSAENGIALFIEEGNTSKFYTNAMKVGVGNNYTSGACSIRVR